MFPLKKRMLTRRTSATTVILILFLAISFTTLETLGLATVPNAEPEGTAEPESGVTPEPESGVTPEPESGATAEPNSEPEGGVTPAAESGAAAEPEGGGTPEPENGATAEPNAEPSAEPSAEPKAEGGATSEPQNKPEPENGATAEPNPESGATSKPEGSPESEPSSEPESNAEGNAEAEGAAEAEERPSPLEIIMPPFGFMILIIIGLFLISINIVTRCRRMSGKAKHFTHKKLHAKVTDSAVFADIIKVASPVKAKVDGKAADEFFSEFDREVLEGMQGFHNHPSELLRIAMPALLSLALCPFTLYLYQPLTTLFWDPTTFKTGAPNINDAINCFLAPAGLVYATSFGFAFQQALSKQTNVLTRITFEVGLLDQIITITSKLSIASDIRLEIYKAIKCEAIFMVLQIANKPLSKFKNVPDEDIKVKIWSIVDKLRNVMPDPKEAFDLDRILADQVMTHILELNSICSDRMSAMHSRIHPLKWAFLESLGFFSFFGILLLRADSYRVELTMCILTVFSISLLCYVVSDLDSPFSGVFRIDLSVLPEVIMRVHQSFRYMRNGHNVVCDYPPRM